MSTLNQNCIKVSFSERYQPHLLFVGDLPKALKTENSKLEKSYSEIPSKYLNAREAFLILKPWLPGQREARYNR